MKVNVVSNLKSNQDTTKIKKLQFKTDLINLDLNNNSRKQSKLDKSFFKSNKYMQTRHRHRNIQ